MEEIVEEKIEKFEGPPRRKSEKLKLTQPKYNLFSMIDEPCNNVFSGKACTCPGN